MRRLWRLLGALVAALSALVALTPTGRYLVRAAWAEGRILARRRPITDLVADSTVDPAIRAKLRLVLEARRYAADSLGLQVGQSFTSYSRLDRDTLVLVLSAAQRDTLAPVRWWFPVVGWVPYKGYFDFEGARRAERDLQQKELDTYLRPSAAFSTLGWFNDPLLSSTLRADSTFLANTVIHELTHNTFYASGQAVFNESFANFVGSRGAQRFFLVRGDTSLARQSEDDWENEKLLGAFWGAVAHQLDSAYAAHRGSRVDRLAARDSVYARARLALVHDVGPRLRHVPVAALGRMRLYNASLLARRIYLTHLELFDEVFARERDDLPRAVQRLIALARSRPADPYGAIRDWLGQPPSPTESTT